MRQSSCTYRPAYQSLSILVAGVAGLLAVETPHAVVVERGVLDELLKRSIDAELDGMLAAVEGERIAQAVVVAAGHRALDRLAERHITADGDLGKGLHALRGEFRAEVAEVDVRRVEPAAEVADVGGAELVDHGGTDGPGVAGVEVLLFPGKVLCGPGHVAGGRLVFISLGVEVAAADLMLSGGQVVDLEIHVVEVGRPALLPLVDAVGHVGTRSE